MTRVKGSERRPFIFSFRLNYVLHDSHQVDEIVMEIEEWKQKVPRTISKALFMESVGDINCILNKLHHMNLKFDYS